MLFFSRYSQLMEGFQCKRHFSAVLIPFTVTRLEVDANPPFWVQDQHGGDEFGEHYDGGHLKIVWPRSFYAERLRAARVGDVSLKAGPKWVTTDWRSIF